ncbi:MAG: sulfatase-like hydrolase/transferase [Lachnospiraceae bacterium]|nr:sulfatase-like hydrolase/transferase [Lachnospiraceae bacterium]
MNKKEQSVKTAGGFFRRHPLAILPLTAFLLFLFVEGLNARNPLGGIPVIFSEPAAFLVGFFVILTVLSLSALFSAHLPAFIILTVLLTVPGIVNLICLILRNSPFQCFDIVNFLTCFDIIFVYFNWTELIVLGLLILIAIVLLVVFAFKAPKSPVISLKKGFAFFFSCLMITVFLLIGFTSNETLPDRFDDYKEAYREYGFSYCFFLSVYDRGVKKPEEYSPEIVNEIVEEETNRTEETDDAPVILSCDHPNVIFLQLESFFDPFRIEGLSLSEDPIPFFRSLKETLPHGLLTVPSIGGGTANTEFEILTAMNLNLFGVGEYPYSSVLLSHPCESVASVMTDLGYASHAIHNHIGTFYNRSTVYPNLGFGTFEPIEYMSDVTVNPLGWAKDAVLTGEILKALASTETRDFIFAVSVQGHGRYPDDPDEDYGPILAEYRDDEKKSAAYRYYVNQISEMDAFLGELTSFLSDYPEQTVLVLYGDHLPPLDVKQSELKEGSVLQTEYVIWTNYAGNAPAARDLQSWELASYAFSLIGIEDGTLNRFLQNADHDDPGFEEDYQTLVYDMLYGEQNVYDGDPPEAAKMQMGTVPVRITGVRKADGEVYLTGTGFTAHSRAFVNGWYRDTEYLTPNLLKLENTRLDDGDEITVRQITHSFAVLGETDPFRYEEENEG